MTHLSAPQIEAAQWHARMLGSQDTASFEQFCAWLEASPDNALAYEKLMEIDADLATLPGDISLADAPRPSTETVPALVTISELASNDNPPAPSIWRRRATWGALSSGLAASLLLGVMLHRETGSIVTTAMGEHKTMQLADGSIVHLNGGSRLLVKDRSQRAVELAAGEASFEVRHDEANPFTVTVGGHELRDVGTRFDVRQDDGGFDVAVAEGSVAFDPGRGKTLLVAGDALAVNGEEKRHYKVAPAQIGSWQQRRLTYDAVALPRIAADLTRLLGITVHISPNLTTKTYTGSIELPANADEAIEIVALTLDLRAQRVGNTVLLSR